MRRVTFFAFLVLAAATAGFTGCTPKKQMPVPYYGGELEDTLIRGELILQAAAVVDAVDQLRDQLTVPIQLEEIEYDQSQGIRLGQAIENLAGQGDRIRPEDGLRLNFYRRQLEAGADEQMVVSFAKTQLGGPSGQLELSNLSLRQALEQITLQDPDYTYEFNPGGCATLFPAGSQGSLLDAPAPAVQIDQMPIQDVMAEDGPVGRLLAARNVSVMFTHQIFQTQDLPVSVRAEPMPLRDLLCTVSRAASPPFAWTLGGIKGLRVIAFEPLIPQPRLDDGSGNANGTGPVDDVGRPIAVKAPCVYQAPPAPTGDFTATPSALCGTTLRVPNNRRIQYQPLNVVDIDRGNAACNPRELADTINRFRWRHDAIGTQTSSSRAPKFQSPQQHNRNMRVRLRVNDAGNPADDPETQVADKQLRSTVPDRDPSRQIATLNCPRRFFGRGDLYGGTVSFNACPAVPFQGSAVRERTGAIGLTNNCNFKVNFTTGGPALPVMAGNQYGTAALGDRLFICWNQDVRLPNGGCSMSFSTQWTIQREDYIRHLNTFTIPAGNGPNAGLRALTTSRTP